MVRCGMTALMYACQEADAGGGSVVKEEGEVNVDVKRRSRRCIGR